MLLRTRILLVRLLCYKTQQHYSWYNIKTTRTLFVHYFVNCGVDGRNHTAEIVSSYNRCVRLKLYRMTLYGGNIR